MVVGAAETYRWRWDLRSKLTVDLKFKLAFPWLRYGSTEYVFWTLVYVHVLHRDTSGAWFGALVHWEQGHERRFTRWPRNNGHGDEDIGGFGDLLANLL